MNSVFWMDTVNLFESSLLILQSLNFHCFLAKQTATPLVTWLWKWPVKVDDSPFSMVFHGFSGGAHYQLAGSPFFNYFEETHQHIPIQFSHSHVGHVISHSHVMLCDVFPKEISHGCGKLSDKWGCSNS